MGISAIQHPGSLAVPDFSNPVRWGGYMWLQYGSDLRLTVVSSDGPLLCMQLETRMRSCVIAG